MVRIRILLVTILRQLERALPSSLVVGTTALLTVLASASAVNAQGWVSPRWNGPFPKNEFRNSGPRWASAQEAADATSGNTSPAPADADAAPQTAAPDKPSRPVSKLRGWPLFYHETNEDGSWETSALFSLYKHAENSDGSVLRVAPFYFSGTNSADQYQWSLAPPLFFRDKSPKRSRFFSLPYSYGSSAESAAAAPRSWWSAPGFLPLVSGSSGLGESAQRAGLPFLFDIYGAGQRGEGSSSEFLTLLPVEPPGTNPLALAQFRRSPDGNLLHSRIMPFYAYSPENSLLVPPLGWLRTWDEKSTTDFVLPMLGLISRSEESYQWHGLLGLAGGSGNAESSHFRLLPIYYSRKTPTTSYYNLLWAFGRERDTERDLSATDLFYPLIRYETRNDGYHVRALPLVLANRSGENSSLAITPFFWHWTSAQIKQSFLFPLFYRRAYVQDEVASGARAEDESTVFFPIYWKFREGQEEDLHILPVYSRIKDADRSWHLFFGPLYVHERNESENLRRHSLFWPLIQFESSDRGGHSHILPFWWSTRDGDNEWSLLAPFYLRSRSGNTAHHWLIPFYGRHETTNDEGTSTIRRFYAGGSVVDKRVVAKDGTQQGSGLLLLGGLAQFDRNDTEKTRHSHVLPLWWHDRTAERSLTIATPLFVRRSFEKDDKFDRLTVAGGNLWVDRHTDEYRERGVVWPLSRYRTDVEGDRRRWDVLGLFSSEEKTGASMLRLSPIYHRHHSDEALPGGSLASYLHVYSHESSKEAHRTRVLGLIYRGYQDQDSRQWDALLGLAGAKTSSDSEHWRILPFYYYSRFGTPEQPLYESSALLPFYWQAVDYVDQSRSQAILFPLYHESRSLDGVSHSLSLAWPLYYRSTSPGVTSGFSAAFLHRYYYEEGGESTWALTPFVRRRTLPAGKESRGLWSLDGYLGLELVRSTRGEQSRTLAIHPFLFGYHEDKESKRTHWHTLFGLAYSSTKGDNTRSMALGFFNRGGNKRDNWWSLFPLHYREHTEEARARRYHWTQACHLYSRVNSAQETRWSTLAYLANGWSRESTGEYDFNLLYGFISMEQNGSYTEKVVEPFYRWESDSEKGSWYFSILKVLYISQQAGSDKPIKRRLLGIPFGG